MRKDLTQFFTPALELAWGEHTFVVQPPSKDTGLKLAAINAVGVGAYLASMDTCPTCGRSGTPEVPAETLELIESMGDVDVADLSLGAEVHAQMRDLEVPGPHIDTMAMYALYYWTLGEATADQIMAAQSGGGASGEAQTSASSTSTPGPRTASGNRTQRRASTRATGASRRR